MQIEVLETFVRVVEVGSFNQTANLMYISQPTVTARMQTLETSLGQKLFHRINARVELTPAGRSFLPYAQAVVRNWRKARQEISLPQGFAGILTVGAPPSLWNHFLLEKIRDFKNTVGTVAFKAVVGSTSSILEMLRTGDIDIAVLYEPSIRSDLATRVLFRDELILVSTTPRELMRWDPNYVYIDWGETFREQHFRAYPVSDTPIVTFSDAKIAVDYLLLAGGAAYVPERWLTLPQYKGKLHPVPHAPSFPREVFVAFNDDLLSPEWRRQAIDNLIVSTNDR